MKNAAKLIINHLPKLKTSFAKLSSEEVLAGVPSSADPRKEKGTKMNNATLAFIHDKGSPAANIPARPFMEPGIESCKDRVINLFKAGAKKALNGENSEVNTTLHKVGLVAQASIRNAINEGIPPPLADSTLRARIRNKTGVKGARAELTSRNLGNPPSSELAKPLVNTAQMRNSINYVLRKK